MFRAGVSETFSKGYKGVYRLWYHQIETPGTATEPSTEKRYRSCRQPRHREDIDIKIGLWQFLPDCSPE